MGPRVVLREPLLWFVVLGGVLFLLFSMTGASNPISARQSHVTAAQLEQMEVE
jgi:hypothetical protein